MRWSRVEIDWCDTCLLDKCFGKQKRVSGPCVAGRVEHRGSEGLGGTEGVTHRMLQELAILK